MARRFDLILVIMVMESFAIGFLMLFLSTDSRAAALTNGVTDPFINEFVFNHTGSDANEFVEIFGSPTTDGFPEKRSGKK